MQNTNPKPAIVPTVLSQKGVLWTLVLIALFGALMWLYTSWSSLAAARERLAEPVKTTVKMPYFTITTPLGWEEWSKATDEVAVWRKKDVDLPILHFLSERDQGFAYHALDVNAAVVLRVIDEDIATERIPGLPETLSLVSKGVSGFTVKPGVVGVRVDFDFDIAPFSGEAAIFYSGDVRYVIWAIWPEDDVEAETEIRAYMSRLFDVMEIPDSRESIDRPIVNSGRLTAEQNERVHMQVEREMALWRLFADRVETGTNAALLPALKHYREVLRLLSSIRQERLALGTDDYKRYLTFLKRRRHDVGEWFVVLDKAMAMRDWDAARSQAKWIIDHATLTGERIDARRASDALAKIPEEGK